MATKSQQYKVQGHTIGPYRCVSINQYDKTLAGRRGEIWQGSDTTCHAIVAHKKSEKIHSFNIKDLHKWVKRLEVPPEPLSQLVWANHPNRRLGE